MSFKGSELFFILVLIVIIFIVLGPRRIGKFLGGLKIRLSGVLAIIGLIGGYILGSKILPMLTYTSWERHVVGTNSSGYTSGLRSAYSSTALLGGIVGAILFAVLGLVVARLFRK